MKHSLFGLHWVFRTVASDRILCRLLVVGHGRVNIIGSGQFEAIWHGISRHCETWSFSLHFGYEKWNKKCH